MKIFFLLLLSFVFLCSTTFNSFATIYQTTSDGSWNTSSIWTPSKPSMGWGFSDTIYIKHNVSLSGNKSIHGYFKVTSTGQLTGSTRSLTVKDDGKFFNDGIVSVKNLTMDWSHLGGENNGTITLANNFTNKEGNFANNGTMNVGATFNNSYDGAFTNDGSLNVTGNFKNYNSFTSSGDIDVGGNFTNNGDGVMSISGDVDVDGNYTNKGTATMDGAISVGGNFTNDWGATFSSSNDLSISGNLSNKGPFTNSGSLSCDDFTSQDSFTSSGTTSIAGDMVNKDEMTNSGDLTVGGDFTNSWGSCDLINSGDITIDGDVTNNGDVSNSDGSTIWVKGSVDNDGSIDNDGDVFIDDGLVGSGAISGDGSLCNSDGVTDPNNSKGNSVSCSTCGNGGLPVELIEFDAEVDKSSVVIFWSTASEEYNDYFELLSSVDGVNFKSIARIKGNGNSNIVLRYKYVDNNANKGINYYQLKQYDYDGKSEMSYIIYVRTKEEINTVKIYPNPIEVGMSLEIEFDDKTNLVELYDVSGRLVKSVSVEGSSTVIDTEGMEKGIYIIRIATNDTHIVKRLILN